MSNLFAACDSGGGGEGDTDASFRRKTDAGVDLSCVELTPIRNFSSTNSGLGVLFTALTCKDKTPVPGLQPSEFVIAEDSKALSSEASPDFVPSRGRRVYITLLLDMSTSTAPAIDQLIAGAKSFISSLLDKGINVYIGIELFDGAVTTTAWQLPIHDAARLAAKLDALKTYKGGDGSSTNLNGAVISAIDSLQKRQMKVIGANDDGVVTQGYLVVFTDGADSADRRKVDEAAAAIAKANTTTRKYGAEELPPVDTYAVALSGKDYNAATFSQLFTGSGGSTSSGGGGSSCTDTCVGKTANGRCEDGRAGAVSSLCLPGTDCTDCRALSTTLPSSGSTYLTAEEAKRRVLEAKDAAELAQRFADLAQRIASQYEGTYLLAYCSPKRQGTHDLKVSLGAATDAASTPITLTFNADTFKGGCSPEFFTSDCNNKQCGGFNCGACDDETETCNGVTDQCSKTQCPPPAAPACSTSSFTNNLGYQLTCDLTTPLTACSNQCIDVRNDPLNCGGCGNRCSAGSSCVQGACACTNPLLTSCGATSNSPAGCFDFQNDAQHCGGCTNSCPSGVACKAGACDCGANSTYCAASKSCVSTNDDANNCGGCGIRCGAGSSCVAGMCTCPSPSQTSCNVTPSTKACVDITTSQSNCGACGKSCGVAGCSASACAACAGTPTNFACNGSCVNLQGDPANCGTCGNACASNQICSSGTCSSGTYTSCSAATLSGTLPITYNGQIVVTNKEAADCFPATQQPTTSLQFVPQVSGIYTFEVNNPALKVEAKRGSCTTPSNVTYAGGSCTNAVSMALTAGTAVRVKVVGDVTANTAFTLSVNKL